MILLESLPPVLCFDQSALDFFHDTVCIYRVADGTRVLEHPSGSIRHIIKSQASNTVCFDEQQAFGKSFKIYHFDACTTNASPRMVYQFTEADAVYVVPSPYADGYDSDCLQLLTPP